MGRSGLHWLPVIIASIRMLNCDAMSDMGYDNTSCLPVASMHGLTMSESR